MSSNISRNEQLFYASTDGTPWHGLGLPLTADIPWSDAVKVIPGIDAIVQARPVFRYAPDGVTLVRCAAQSVVRATDDFEYGVSGVGYKPCQTEDAVKVLDQVFGAQAKLAVGGILDNGDIWLAARLPFEISVGGNGREGDKLRTWLMVFVSHRPGNSNHFALTSIRPVCRNTINAGLAEVGVERHGQKAKLEQGGQTLIHKGNIAEKLGVIGRNMTRLVGIAEKHGEELDNLTRKVVGEDVSRAMVAELLRMPDEISQRGKDKLDEIISLSKAPQNVYAPGTCYDLLNGITDYVDHNAHSADFYAAKGFAYTVTGTGSALKGNALTMLLEYEPDQKKTYAWSKRLAPSAAPTNVLGAILNASE